MRSCLWASTYSTLALLCPLLGQEEYHYRVYLNPLPSGAVEVQEKYFFNHDSSITRGLLYLKTKATFFSQAGRIEKVRLYQNNLPLRTSLILHRDHGEKAIIFEKLQGTNLEVRYVVEEAIRFHQGKGYLSLLFFPLKESEILSIKFVFLSPLTESWVISWEEGSEKKFKKQQSQSIMVLDAEQEVEKLHCELIFSLPKNWLKKETPFNLNIWRLIPYLIFTGVVMLFLKLPLPYLRYLLSASSLTVTLLLLADTLSSMVFYFQLFRHGHEVRFLWRLNLLVFAIVFWSSLFLFLAIELLDASQRSRKKLQLLAKALLFLILSSFVLSRDRELALIKLFLCLLIFLAILRYATAKDSSWAEKLVMALSTKKGLSSFDVQRKNSHFSIDPLEELAPFWGAPLFYNHDKDKIMKFNKKLKQKKEVCPHCGNLLGKKTNLCAKCGKEISQKNILPFFIHSLASWLRKSISALFVASLITGIAMVLVLFLSKSRAILLWATALSFPFASLVFYKLLRLWPLRISRGLWFKSTFVFLVLQGILLFPLYLLWQFTKRGHRFFFFIGLESLQSFLSQKKEFSLKEMAFFLKTSIPDTHLLCIHLNEHHVLSYDVYHLRVKGSTTAFS
ncbi:MAG: zinc ribbon domain-containing protein [Leptospiraceae bacterium]|nr:zinc ribbon domain-containing protein [Leptospiraceae bacterium]